ncbi:MAG: hypothetical protein HY264_08985 [Chloroflexi bacterium]|nr:hypothetical protein [Chloroflexota bacterium]
MVKPFASLLLWFYAGWSLGAFASFATGAPDFGLVIGIAFGAMFWVTRGRFVLNQGIKSR